MSDGGDDCWLCGGCGEVDATSAVTPVPETVGCPVCIAAEKREQLAAMQAALERAETRLHWVATMHDSLEYAQDRARAYRDEVRAALAQTEEGA